MQFYLRRLPCVVAEHDRDKVYQRHDSFGNSEWPMNSRNSKPSSSKKGFEWSVPFLLLVAFGLGAGAMWLIMRGSTDRSPSSPEIQNFLSSPSASAPLVPQPAPPAGAPAPDVSQLAPAEAARTLANWNYDGQNWPHAIEHYEQAIALGADNADVRTDLGNCYRFLGQPEKALAEYQLAQKKDPQHENSLFNQISLFVQLLHDQERAAAAARVFIARFPQSPQAEAARRQLAGTTATSSP